MPASRGLRFLSRLIVLPALGAAFAAATARSQTGGTPRITLEDAVNATLAGNVKIRFDQLRADNFRGQVVAAAAPFDGQVQTSITNGHDNQQLPLVVNGIPVEAWTAQDAVSYEVRLDKQFRSGVTLSPTLTVSRTGTRAVQSQQFPIAGAATAGLNVVVPLLANRGGSVNAVAERVVERDWRGTVEDARHTVASTVNDVVSSYWSYVAAERRLDAYVAAEARAQRMVDETVILVRKEERAPADLKQVSANLASKRATRIGAEQALVEARQQLGLLMGLGPAAVIALPASASDFPAVPNDTSDDAGSIERLTALALARRSDLAAAHEKQAATVLELDEFRNAAKPHVDLTLGFGFTGSENGIAFNRFFAPLYRNVPGLNASVQLTYQLPTANAAARGRVMQEDAFLAQQRLAEQDVARQIVTSVIVSVQALQRSRVILQQSEAASGFYTATVENERRKFQLGMSTLFDVLNAEDGLTNAVLAEINGRRAYATALATLRFVTGTLVDWADGHAVVPSLRFGSAP
jgi:outer membrane protein